MAADPATVAIPVLNGGDRLHEVLRAVRAQRLDRPIELLVADSGSTDGSVAVARSYGAEVLPVRRQDFSHGGTRNTLFERASGSHVAFLTQDSVPADERWLGHLLAGFAVADDVALVFGPYLPRDDASPMVARELQEYFGSFAPGELPQVDRRDPRDDAHARRAAFFSSANGCIARWAWSQVPFPEVEYAEDQALARAMLAFGFAKAYHPAASVIHSHDYPPIRLFQRSFDEWRALHDVRGVEAAQSPLAVALTVQRRVRDDTAYARGHGLNGRALALTAVRSVAYHCARSVGAALGSRAERLPAPVRRACSLESRAGRSARQSRALARSRSGTIA